MEGMFADAAVALRSSQQNLPHSVAQHLRILEVRIGFWNMLIYEGY
jgi:hypothetical protein